MPGKHAPASPKSFYLSLARAGTILAVVLGVTIGIAIVATGGSKKPLARPSTSLTPTPSASVETPIAPPVQVVVLNGTTRQGLGAVVAARLTADGWTVKGTPDNGPATAKTTIYVRNNASADAERLRRMNFSFMSQDAVVIARAGDPGSADAALTVVIGSDYPKTPTRKSSSTP